MVVLLWISAAWTLLWRNGTNLLPWHYAVLTVWMWDSEIVLLSTTNSRAWQLDQDHLDNCRCFANTLWPSNFRLSVLMLLTKRNVNLTWSSKIQMSCWETWIPTTGPSCPALMTWNFTYRPVQSTSMCGQLCFASDFFYEDTCIYLTTWLRIDLYASILNMKTYKHNIGPCSHLVTRFKEKTRRV